MPQAEVANLMQPFGENVHQEAAEKLVTGYATGAPTIRFARFVTQDHAMIIDADEAAVGDGGAEDIARQMIEDRLLALAPRCAMDDPILAPHRGWENQVRPSLLEN